MSYVNAETQKRRKNLQFDEFGLLIKKLGLSEQERAEVVRAKKGQAEGIFVHWELATGAASR